LASVVLLITVLVALAVILAVVAAIAIVAGRSARRRLLRLEARAARAEREAAGELHDRLRVLRRRVGVLYFDGLPTTRSRRLFEAFAEGVKQAGRSQWDQAAQSWRAGLDHARDSEVVALHFLVGACHFAAERRVEARAALEATLAAARAAGDRYGVAATVNALGMLARAENRLPDALAGFTRAAALWGELDELRDQARTLVRVADVLEEQGDTAQALARHREALRVSEVSGDAVGAMREHGSVGRLLALHGELDAARAACEDGLLLARKAGDRAGEVELLAMVGDLFLRQRSYKRALEVFERALRHRGDGRGPVSEAAILAGLAQASEGMGRAEVASEYYERALERAREEKLGGLQAVCLAGLAVAAQRHGALEKARSLLDLAVELDRTADAGQQLGRHLVARAVLAVEMHDPAGAGRDLDEALRIAQAAGGGAPEVRVAMVQARMLVEDGRLADAQEKLRSASAVLAGVTDPELAADYHFESGHVARAAGLAEQALAAWRAAVDGYGRAGLVDAQARAEMFLAEALAEAGRVEDGAAAAAEALRLIHRSGMRKDEIRALRAVAFVDAKRGRTRDAHLTLDRAVALARETRDRWSEAAVLLALGRLAREVEVFDAARDNLVAARRLFGELGAAVRVIEIDREVERLPSPDTGVQFVDQGS
jgi:tetratricopeptide (TPR) repeat protein